MIPITSEAALPLIAVGAGTIAAILWLWKYPQDIHVKAIDHAHATVLEVWQKRLEECERARDEDRQAHHERVRELEGMHRANIEALRNKLEGPNEWR